MPLRRRRPRVAVERQPDDLPRTGLFTEPVRVAALTAQDPEQLEDGRYRATFRLEVRDAHDRRCPDLAVEARVSGPERSRTVQGSTDLLGRIRFRMVGPSGTYHLEVTDVAAKGLAWDAAAGPRSAEIEVTG